MSGSAVPPSRAIFQPLLAAALAEDLGLAGDVTSEAVVPASATLRAEIVARTAGRVAGITIGTAVFGMLDDGIGVEVRTADGEDAPAGSVLATVSGPARPILTGERTALNLIGRLSGIATATRAAVAAVAGTGARITGTRKTTPGMRALEHYAIRAGGGAGHRVGLFDAILVKDNHLDLAGGITAAVAAARTRAGHLMSIEVEVETLEQLGEALAAGAKIVMLDNMDSPTLRRAVEMTAGRAVLEASGGITPDRLAEVAATGVDVISLGWLTHSAPALDVGLDVS